jgi:ABC-type nitrate/sulfonate/bicarbonate transport system substrate-binding protein
MCLGRFIPVYPRSKESMMRRREFLQLCAVAAVGAISRTSGAQVPFGQAPKELRIGYQRNGFLVIARRQGVIERNLDAYGVEVKWIEFASGLPMLEAMDLGSVDIGQVGDTPPIFAQAAGAAIVYVAVQPIANGQGIPVRPGSDVSALADSFYIGNCDFAARYPDVLREVIDALAETAVWAEANRDKAARSLADVTGVDLDIPAIPAGRSSFAIGKVTEDIIASQQAVADRLCWLGLIPKPIVIRDAVWLARNPDREEFEVRVPRSG